MVMVCLGVRTDYMVLSRSPTRVEIARRSAVAIVVININAVHQILLAPWG